MDNFITFMISVLTAGVTAFITYTLSIRTNIQNKELELKKEQAFKYFLPLKFAADELFHRLIHIEEKIMNEKEVNIQLPKTLDDKTFDWYFIDWIDSRDYSKGVGGYYLATTIFMHAQLYYRINMLLKEYPFLIVKIKRSLSDYLAALKNQQLTRCYETAVNDAHTRRWVDIEELSSKRGKVKLERLIKCVRLAAVMHGGIPYGLQTAFGQFLEKTSNGKIDQINYEEFVRILMNEKKRVKFSPLYRFYYELVDENFNVDPMKLTKLRALIIALLFFRDIELA